MTQAVAVEIVGLALHSPNRREHWGARARRTRYERAAVTHALDGFMPPPLPVVVVLTRIAGGRPLDGDNLQGACKAVRDAVAACLGCDDADPRVTWCYSQDASAGRVMLAPRYVGKVRLADRAVPFVAVRVEIRHAPAEAR